jgi:hypothetical protein
VLLGFPVANLFKEIAQAQGEEREMIKVALVGDTIFDDEAYVLPGQDVITWVKRHLGRKGNAILLSAMAHQLQMSRASC